MSKINAKIKWNGRHGAVTVRLSGGWLDVLKSMHMVGQRMAEEAKTMGFHNPAPQQPCLPGLPSPPDDGKMAE